MNLEVVALEQKICYKYYVDTPIHIIVVDDEADLVELVSYNLRKEGFIVDTASDGEKALKIRKGAIRFDPDLMLPGIQGIELCRIVKNDPKTTRLPIIMLTAKGEEVDRISVLRWEQTLYVKTVQPKGTCRKGKGSTKKIRKTGTEKILKIGELEIDRENILLLSGENL